MKYRIILEKKKHKILLKTESNNKPVELDAVFSKVKELAEAKSILSRELSSSSTFRWATSTTVDYSFLSKLLQNFGSVTNKNLEIIISDEVKNYKEIDAPNNFFFNFVFDKNLGALAPDPKYTYNKDGYFGSDKGFFKLKVRKKDEEWLKKDYIPGKEIFEFLTEIVPEWQSKGFPFGSDVSFVNTPIITLSVQEVTDDYVSIAVNQNEDYLKAQIIYIESSSSHILNDREKPSGYYYVNNKVMLGFEAKGILKDKYFSDGFFILKNQDIPKFLEKNWPIIKNFTTGKRFEFLYKHQIYDDPESVGMKLKARAEKQNGIYSFTGDPVFKFGSYEISKDALFEAIDKKKKFLKVSSERLSRSYSGWIEVKPFKSVIKMLEDVNFKFDAVPLDAANVLEEKLYYGRSFFHKVSIPVELPFDFDIEDKIKSLKDPISHYETLTEFGLSGGIINPEESIIEVIFKFLASHRNNFPDTKILLVCPNDKEKRFVVKFNKICNVLALDDLTAKNINYQDWDIVFVYQADILANAKLSKNAKRLDNLNKIQKRVLLGSFREQIDKWPNDVEKTLGKLFEAKELGFSQYTWDCRVQDYEWTKLLKLGQFKAGLIGSHELPHATDLFISSIPMHIYAKVFIEDANLLKNTESKKAKVIKYTAEMPSFYDMSPEQTTWYFTWRAKIREGIYMDTNYSYIKLYAFELINNIGVKDHNDAIDKLYHLWKAFKDKHKEVDKYFLNWIIDYILIYEVPVNPLDIILEVSALYKTNILEELGEFCPSLLLNYWNYPISKLPFSLFLEISEFTFSQSFFNEHNEFIREHVSKIFENIDNYLKSVCAKGIFEFFRPLRSKYYFRSAFSGALWVGDNTVISIENAVNYARYPALVNFLGIYLKYIEGKLRKIKGVKGTFFVDEKELDPFIQNVIDTYILNNFKNEVEKFKVKFKKSSILEPILTQKVNIDMSKVTQLAKESEEVRELFITEKSEEKKPKINIEEKKPEIKKIEPVISMSIDDEWKTFKSALSDNQIKVIKAIVENEFPQEEISKIAKENFTMPENIIDSINEIALELIGDILINSNLEIEPENLEEVKQLILSSNSVTQ